MRKLCQKYVFLLFFIISCFVLSGNKALAQYVREDVEASGYANPFKKLSFTDRLFYGGNIGASFGDITLVDISPLVGYKITPRLSAGVGGTYTYYQYKTDPASHLYGGRIFGRYFLTETIFAHTEIEGLNFEKFSVNDQGMLNASRQWVVSPMIGGGAYTMISDRAGLNFMVLYILNHNQDTSPYPNPVLVRVGVVF